MKTYKHKLIRDHIAYSVEVLAETLPVMQFLKSTFVRHQLYQLAADTRDVEKGIQHIFSILTKDNLEENEQPENFWRRNY